MDKITYLAELAEGLARWVPERERQDILRYYAEYFDEAGPEREAEVVAELGDPWALSCRLAVEGGFVSQEAANRWTPPKKHKRSLEIAGCVAIVMIVVVVAAASLASNVGRLVGRIVGSTTQVTSVAEEYGFASLPYDIEGNTYFYGDGPLVEGAEVIGGFWSMEDGYLAAFYDIDVDISLGNIIITGGEDYTLAIQQSGDLGGYCLDWKIQGDTLKIRDGSSGSHNIGFGELGNVLGKKALDVIITVPEGAYLQKVDVKTDMGNIYLAELNVEVKVTGKTNMGDVDGCNIWTTQKVELKTSMGNVTFGLGEDEVYNDMDIDLETDMGDVEVNLECYESECAYELETDMGTVSINGVSRGTKAERKGAWSVKLDAETSKGDVAVYFLDDRWQ